MHPVLQIIGLLLLAATCTAAAGLSAEAAYKKYHDLFEPISLKYLIFQLDEVTVKKSDADKVKKFFNKLDQDKGAANDSIEKYFQDKNDKRLSIARKANDYAFKIFRDMWFVQHEWLERNGRYFQGKATISPSPELGSDSQVEFGFGLTHQIENWPDIGYLDQESPVSIRSDVYDGPKGKGYIVTVQFKINGQDWTMQMHEGPEDRGESFVWKHPEPTTQSGTTVKASSY